MINKELGILLLSTIALTLILSVFVFFMGIGIKPFTFPISYLISTVFFLYYSEQGRINKIKTVIGCLFIIALSVFISSLIYDYSFDGQFYHQVAIYYLIKGWNPIYETCPSPMNDSILWVDHYAKGMEIIAANISSVFNNIETGKSLNLIMTFITYAFVSDFLKSDMLLNRAKTHYYALLITFSPVICAQLFTYYIDWVLYSFLAILSITLYHIICSKKISREDLCVISMIIILSISSKFNFIFWIGLCIGLVIIYCIKNKEKSLTVNLTAISILSLLLGFIISYNPYITNILSGHHILYPLMGGGKIDIMTIQTPDGIIYKNYFVSVILSLFSRPSQNDVSIWIFSSKKVTIAVWVLLSGTMYCITRYRYKLKTNTSNISVLLSIIGGVSFFILLKYYWSGMFFTIGEADMRLGGFGYFFPEIIIMTFISLFSANKSPKYKKAFILMSCLIISLFLLPSGWWARYVPFFFIFAFIPIIYVEKYGSKVPIITTISTALMLTNSLLIIEWCIHYGCFYTETEKAIVEFCKKESPIKIKETNNNGFLFKLQEAGVDYELSKESFYKTSLTPEVMINKAVD